MDRVGIGGIRNDDERRGNAALDLLRANGIVGVLDGSLNWSLEVPRIQAQDAYRVLYNSEYRYMLDRKAPR